MKAAGPDAIFFGGYYAEAGQLKKQLADAGVDATFVSGDGALDAGFIEAAGDAAEGAILSCPCYFATERPRTRPARRVRHRVQGDPAPCRHLLGRGLRRGQHPPRRHPRGEHRPRVAARLRRGPDARRRTRISKDVEFEENGNIEAQGIFIFEVKDGEIVLRSPPTTCRSPSHQHAADRGRPRRAPSVLRPREGATASSSTSAALGDQFWRQTVDGLTLGSIYALDRARLHAGLRRAAPHQLRPLRDLHARHLRHHSSRSTGMGIDRAPGRPASPSSATLLVLLAAGDGRLGRGRGGAWSASPTGRSAGATRRASPR